MEAFLNLIERNNKMFRRDKTAVFFSLLSVIIVIGLYALFLQKMQIDSLKQASEATPELITMVNEWFVAGLLSMIAVSTTLGTFGIAIKDIESKTVVDFLTAPVSRATIQMSYVLNAIIIGFIFSFIALIVCEIFIVATGGTWLSFSSFLKVIGILALSVLLASIMNVFFTLLVNTQNSFAALSTIVGTLLGFLCGVYVPIGALPGFAQNIVMYFPVSHTTLLLRNAFMENSLTQVFAGAPTEAIEQYKLIYGITYKLHGTMLSHATSYIIILSSIIILTILSISLFKRKHR
ncbi:ABC transporter permease [Bacillus ndiopicus]|uniref:ABC transporter permease n=1 Tax=Bacillus ndiopicus TaxID=1347368 RepID=UPI0005A5F8CD|nr:ABC transporter permease [Bacillus ndiopicus]